MEPIINPVIIYLIETLEKLHVFLHFIIAISGVLCICMTLYYFYTKDTTKGDYIAFYTEEQRVQKEVTSNAYQVKNKLTDILEILRERLDGSDKENLQKLQNTADDCCLVFNSINHKLTKLTEEMNVHNNTLNFCKKWAIRSLIIFFTIMLMNGLIPSTDTAYKMLIASYITPDNLGLMKETSKEAIEYIITQITTSIQSLR